MTDLTDITLRSRIFSELLRKNRDKIQRETIESYSKPLNYEPLCDFMISESAWQHVSALDVDPKFVFAHPDMLLAHPNTSLYYRGLALISQKQVREIAKTSIASWENENQTARVKPDSAVDVVCVYNTMISSIIEGSSDWTMENGYRNIIATMGVTIDGIFRNKIGQLAEKLVRDRLLFWLIEQGFIESETPDKNYQLPNNIQMKFGSEPDVNFTRDGHSIATLEIKGGSDPAGALERLGAMRESFAQTPADCTNFLIAKVITDEMKSRLAGMDLVESFLLDEISFDEKSWNDFIYRLFHHTLRIFDSDTINQKIASKSDDTDRKSSQQENDSPGISIRGTEVISDFVKRLPNSPGVYRMIGENGDVLYVGKARSLKKRVHSYTRIQGQSNRIVRMIQATADMVFVTTRTETEALLLEANLIKRFKPKFNVLMRDDKSFPYILLTGDHEAPAIMKHRGARKKKGDYFGPFASVTAVNSTLNTLQKAFLLRNCSDSYYSNRSRPCLLHQIKRCAAPCTGEISSEEYSNLVNEAKRFLSGKSKLVKSDMVEEMQKASKALDFERAAEFRDRLSALSHVQSHQGINPQTFMDADVFAIHQEGGENCIQVFFFRTGHNWGNHSYFPKADKSLDQKAVLQSFLTQFYDDKPIPGLILLSCKIEEQALLSDALSEKVGQKVTVATPSRGEKKDVVEHAALNAKQAMQQKLAENSSQKMLLDGLKEKFELADTPRRIEVYDNSHIMGKNAVGAMIVAGVEGFVKNQYRKFNIKSENLVPGDDYGMMREVFKRRFSRLIRESGEEKPGNGNSSKTQTSEAVEESIPVWPDLVLIDGGKGQLNVVQETLTELGITDLPLVGVAKGPQRDAGREKFHMHGRGSFMLPERDPVLYFIQRLRDEAHRFAIGSHRARRKKEIGSNPLDEIEGIGPARKRALLLHFGTAKAVSQAGLDDLRTVEGISDSTAKLIFDFFHDRN